MKSKIKVLFLCTGNSCRSQMAEGWAKHLKDGIIEAYSAGTEPKGLNPYAVQSMKNAGVDISHHKSQSIEDLKSIFFDVVVTVCGHAHETCPHFTNASRIIHHGFDDPPHLARQASSEAETMLHYDRVRDEIKEFILKLSDNVEDHNINLGQD